MSPFVEEVEGINARDSETPKRSNQVLAIPANRVARSVEFEIAEVCLVPVEMKQAGVGEKIHEAVRTTPCALEPRVGGSSPSSATNEINDLSQNPGSNGVATVFDASQAFSRPYHPLPNIPRNTNATRRSRNVPVVDLHPAKAKTALDLWLSGFASENTRRAYRNEIEAFAAFAGWDGVGEAVTHFLALEDGPAHAVADKWRAEKILRGLSPASINRSMAALNSLVASTRRHGITTLRLEAKGMKSKPYRDTKGPGLRGVQTMLAVATDHKRPEKAGRDAAILRLAYGLGLRRGEIAGLNIGHCDLMGERLHVLGKGRSEREAMTIPANVKQALSAWLRVRGTDSPDAPLFVALDNHSRGSGKRITGAGLFHIVRALGEQAGLKVRPHGLRHTAITAALDAFNGDYRQTRAFSRHASLDTVRRYDDNRADHAGQVAQALDAILG